MNASRLNPGVFVGETHAKVASRMRIHRILLIAASLLATRAARADECSQIARSTCINAENYWPHAGPSRFAFVGSAQTVARGELAFGLLSSYQSRPVIIRLPSPGTSTTDQYAINDQVNANFLWSYGVTNRLALDFALPITLVQGGTGLAPITGAGGLRDSAFRDLRFGAAYALIPRSRVDTKTADANPHDAGNVFALAARFEVSAPTGDKNAFAGERAAVFAPSVAADYRRSRWTAGLEVGARIRPVAEFIGARVGTQALIGAAIGYDILDRERLTTALEARALYTLSEQHDATPTATGYLSTPNGNILAPAEWALSVRSAPFLAGDIAFLASGGTSLGSDAITSPRFRFTLGFTYAPLARDSDGDGILDRNDLCPHEKAFGEPRDGCHHDPESQPASSPAGTEAPHLN